MSVVQILPNMCFSCKHLQEPFDIDGGNPACAAYPEGIPDVYWVAGAPHVDPDEDGGIVWELADDSDIVLDAWVGTLGGMIDDSISSSQ